jgi:hypothetical protein
MRWTAFTTTKASVLYLNNMIIIKTTRIEIDLDKERKRVKKCKYSAAQQARLLKLYALFEDGRFKECIAFTEKWGRTKDEYPEVEHIHPQVWDILGYVQGSMYGDGSTVCGVALKL